MNQERSPRPSVREGESAYRTTGRLPRAAARARPRSVEMRPEADLLRLVRRRASALLELEKR